MDAYDYSDKLSDSLLADGTVVDISKKFQELEDNNERILFAEEVLKKHNLIPNFEELKLKKNNKFSDEFRNDGNQFYKDKNFQKALEMYNKSLCFAEWNSENVGLAYANRSAVYSEMGYYEKALENIELARNHNYPRNKLDKLKIREDQCLENLNNKPQTNKFQEHEAIRSKVLKEKFPGNKNTPFYVAECLEMKRSPAFGRYIVTNQNLKVGTVIAVEEPFSKSVIPAARYKRCSNCLVHNLLNLFPCEFCCSTMFCSEECRKINWEKYHQFVCPIVDVMDTLFTKIMLIALRTFFEALSIFNGDAVAMKEFLNSIESSEATVFDFDFTKMSELESRKTLLHTIDALVTNESSRTNSDLFQRSNVCAIMSNLLLNHTTLGSNLNEETAIMFRKFIFKQSQISALNFHGLYGMSDNSLDEDQFGSGSFPFCSLINHSCVPNLVRVNFKAKNYVVVNRPVKAGEQIFDNYGFHHCLETHRQRQAGLNSQYKFLCRCIACESPTKFPLYQDLQHKDSLNFDAFLGNDLQYLSACDLNRAYEKFDSYCRYIDEKDGKNYPCYEISSLQECLLRCLRIFTQSENF